MYIALLDALLQELIFISLAHMMVKAVLSMFVLTVLIGEINKMFCLTQNILLSEHQLDVDNHNM